MTNETEQTYNIGVKIREQLLMIRLPNHLRNQERKTIVEYLANKIAYHNAMADVYKNALREVREGKMVEFEDDEPKPNKK